MTVYDPVTNLPVAPTPLDDARESLASARRWAGRTDDPLPPETARGLVGFWAAEVARLTLAERDQGQRENGRASGASSLTCADSGRRPPPGSARDLSSRSASVSGKRLARDEAA